MAQFFASCPRGLVDVLEKEFNSLGFKILNKSSGGIDFETTWVGCYKANLYSRIASRILKPVLEFTAYQPDELYGQIRKHDFTKYIQPNQTITIDANISDSKMHDQRFVAMKIKDAIVDQFREKFGERPNIDNENPDMRVYVRAYKNNFDVSLDTSGDPLFMRGYRKEAGEAPLKENLAAGLIELSEWDGQTPLVDVMCGSGTLLIEAAMKALNIAPGLNRKRFGFMNWNNFDSEAWDELVSEAIASESEDLDFKFYGYDLDKKVLLKAKDNAKRAGVAHVIDFRPQAVAVVEAPVEKAMLVTNPPYGARIGEEDVLVDLYRDLSHTMKHRFKGWDCWLLSGNKDLITHLKLKSNRKHFVYNGAIECRFLRYSMF